MTYIVLFLVMLASLIGCQGSRAPADQKENPPAAGTTATATKKEPGTSRAGLCPHDAPKELCFICDASLREKGRLWCSEHNRYEDRCWECHPEARDAARAFCTTHNLYQDECFLCTPALRSATEARSEPAGSTLLCEEHGVPEAECGICHPEAVGTLAQGQGLKVRFTGADAAERAGVQSARGRVGPAAEAVEAVAEITFNENALARIAAPVGGILQSVDVDLGARVGRGTVLARLWSATISDAVTKAVLARQTLDRERVLHAGRISSERELQEAEATHRAAHDLLLTLGFSEKEAAEAGRDSAAVAMLAVRAPFAGEIIERNAVRGALVDGGTTLFSLVDRSTMWAMLSVPENQAVHVRVGQTVELQVDALPGETFSGTVTWVAPQVDEHTRMARVRAEVRNPNRTLSAHMFGRARVLIADTRQSLIVPSAAIQPIDDRPFVFVKLADDLYEARLVAVGAKRDGETEVRAGLRPEDEIVVAGGFIVKSQLLLSRLGAGCVDD